MPNSAISTIVVMGVSGAGKTTLGKALALSLDWEFLEGDDFHPSANIKKMKNNIALDDDDRWPWLMALNEQIKQNQLSGIFSVVSCSALKKIHREILRKGINNIKFVYLYGEPQLIQQRLNDRKNHFMSADLLDSQLASLEVPENALLVSIDLPVGEQVNAVREHLNI